VKTMYRFTAVPVVCTVCFVLCISSCTPPKDMSSDQGMLPLPGFAEGWRNDGKVDSYTRDTLFEFINGEAELYMPYGFTVATVTTYRNGDNTIEAAVYEMGSLLDAFGVYSNYRYPEEPVTDFGADGFYDDYQLMFYQDKYFVRLNAHGDDETQKERLLACGRAIARRLPQPARQPAELEMFKFGGVEPRTEVYHAESVLGYAFFTKGFLAKALLDGQSCRVFVVTVDTEAGAETSMQQYLDYLKENNVEPKWVSAATGECLAVQDPLYKDTIVLRTGPYLLGAIELSDPARGVALIDQLYAHLPPSG